MDLVKGVASITSLLINMVFWTSILFFIAIARLLIPYKPWRHLCTKLTISIGEICIDCNTLWMKLIHKTKLVIKGLDGADKDLWYIGTSNHQSWADIFILQAVTNRKVPLLRFFMKDVLKWIPIVWVVGWSLDMPFLKRYSDEKLKKHPELRGKDFIQMKKAFKRLNAIPGSVFSFAEGTRYTEKKKINQSSPFENLLLPKAGGIGVALSTMPFIESLLDFSIYYHSDKRSFWDFLCGRMSVVEIRARKIKIPEKLKNKDYSSDSEYRENLKKWLREIWEEKNQFMRSLTSQGSNNSSC